MRTTFLHNSQRRRRVQKTVSGLPPPLPPQTIPSYLNDDMSATCASSSSLSSSVSSSISTQQPSVRVLRSLSVPCNLPMVAENFIKAVKETMEDASEEESKEDLGHHLTGNQGYLSLSHADSFRSEEEFLLRFDDDDDFDNDVIIQDVAALQPQTTQLQTDGLESPPSVNRPSTGPEAAVERLEEFFLGGSTLHSQIGFPTASTMESDLALHMELPTEAAKAPPFTEIVNNDDYMGNESLTSVQEEHCEASSARTPVSPSLNHHHRFVKMTKKHRTMSLPLELAVVSGNSPRTVLDSPGTMPRRSSLKKISSYHQFPSSKPSSPTNHSLKRNVSFGSMKIREYNVALSDHPSCSYGPPIQLSWEYQEKEEVPLESYESSRKGNRRSGHSLLLSFYERHFMLIQQAGYSKKEIMATMKEVERVKRERMVTDLFLPASPLDETMEHVLDTVKKFLRPRPQADTFEQQTTIAQATV